MDLVVYIDIEGPQVMERDDYDNKYYPPLEADDDLYRFYCRQVAQYLDQCLESENYHSCVGMYEELYEICEDNLSPQETNAVFAAIVKNGGLINF